MSDLSSDLNMRPPLKDFQGRWRFERQIDHADGDPATVTGRAVFTPVDEGLRYDETGELRLNDGPPMTATRSYLWHEGGVVLFEDGRDFHIIPDTHATATHLCGDDTYVVRYDFSAWPNWTSQWTVTGPKKSYVMITTYRPD